jgi:hypothetical protein
MITSNFISNMDPKRAEKPATFAQDEERYLSLSGGLRIKNAEE